MEHEGLEQLGREDGGCAGDGDGALNEAAESADNGAPEGEKEEEAGEEAEDSAEPYEIEGLVPTCEMYLAPDGTPLIWDPATVWLLRARYRMLPRAVGAGYRTGERAVPASLMSPAAALALERGWLTLKKGPARRAGRGGDPEPDGSPPRKRAKVEGGAGADDVARDAGPCDDTPPGPEAMLGYALPLAAEKRAVYEDLWERGLTVGPGNPYGADFTIYEGACVAVVRVRSWRPPGLPLLRRGGGGGRGPAPQRPQPLLPCAPRALRVQAPRLRRG